MSCRGSVKSIRVIWWYSGVYVESICYMRLYVCYMRLYQPLFVSCTGKAGSGCVLCGYTRVYLYHGRIVSGSASVIRESIGICVCPGRIVSGFTSVIRPHKGEYRCLCVCPGRIVNGFTSVIRPHRGEYRYLCVSCV